MKKNILFLTLIAFACLMWQCGNGGGDEPKPRYTTVSTFVGGGTGIADGTGTVARFNNPYSITKDSQGNFFVVDNQNQTVRKITPQGVVSTFAGSAGQVGDADGTGSAARFRNPTGICIDASDNLYVAEFNGNRIRKITPAGVVTTFVGSTTAQEGSTDATGTAARFRGISDIAIDTQGNLYVADGNNNKVRKVTPAGVVTTLATPSNGIRGIFISPQGTLYISDNGKISIVNTTTGAITLLAGADMLGYVDGQGANARFRIVHTMDMDSEGNLIVTDSDNRRVRKITANGTVTTIAGSGAEGTTDGNVANATFIGLIGIYVDKPTNTIYVTDVSANNIRKID
ncbi:MAG: hypothetical protein MUE85_15355 [Microscillaceae bacterium]|jgi:sugar lactone lactonase YvrE|nr:hypothetical protein [Microscillaceae bacterium]